MRLLDLFYPPKCVACGKLLDWHLPKKSAFCKDCIKHWENSLLESCGLCATPVKRCTCMTVNMEKAGCVSFFKCAYYHHSKGRPVQNQLLFSMKRAREERIFSFAASELSVSLRDLMKEEGMTSENTVIVFSPRSRSAYLQFGVDQARSLAKALSRELGLPLCAAIKRRIELRHGLPQKKRTPKERLLYANRCYALAKTKSKRMQPEGKMVLLVDDVVTTGATMAACSRLLYTAGAERVFCVSVLSDDFNRDGRR